MIVALTFFVYCITWDMFAHSFFDLNFVFSTATVTSTIMQPMKANYRRIGICLGDHGSLPRLLLGRVLAVRGSFSCSKSGRVAHHCDFSSRHVLCSL